RPPRRRAVHVLPRLASTCVAAVRSRSLGGVLRRARASHPDPARPGGADELSHATARAYAEVSPHVHDPRSALPGSVELDPGRAPRARRAGGRRGGRAAAGQDLLGAGHRTTRERGAAGLATGTPAGTALRCCRAAWRAVLPH